VIDGTTLFEWLRPGDQFVKIVACALLTLLTTSLLTGCGGGAATGASTPTPTPPAAISGVETPKSVAVVTAN
jgi:hypothetical protein